MFCVFPEHLHSSSIHLHIPTYVNIYTQSEESAQISQKQDERNIYAIYIYIYIPRTKVRLLISRQLKIIAMKVLPKMFKLKES